VSERMYRTHEPRSGASAATQVTVARLTEQLCRSLAAHGPALPVNLALVQSRGYGNAAQGDDAHAAPGALSAWLDELEVAPRFLVYEGDPGAPAWTRRCMRQVDRVVFVANAEADVREARHTVKQLLGGAHTGRAREELVLLHADGTSPSGTAAWLALRPFAAHHHLYAGAPHDVERLSRCFTGTSLGIVLSGGAAKALRTSACCAPSRKPEFRSTILGGRAWAR